MDSTTKRVLFAIIAVVIIAILVLGAIFLSALQSSQQKGQEVGSTNDQGQIQSEQNQSIGPVQVFYIVPGVDSATHDIGCGDSVRSVIINTDRDDIIQFALEKLFANKTQQTQDGYYNALWQSNVIVESVDIENKKVKINLSGDFILNGECDGPRAQAQIEQTANVAASQQLHGNPDEVEININGQTLDGSLEN